MEAGRRRTARSIAIELTLFAAVAAFAVLFAHWHQTRNMVHPPAALDRLCAFSAETPYQNRVLVPLVLRALQESGLGERPGLTLEAGARLIDVVCVIGLFYALRALLSRFAAGVWPSILGAALGLYALPFLYVLPRAWPYWYPWDSPAVLFTTLGLLWIKDQRWAWYYWIFPFATLNRETTLFLILAFALTQFGRMKWLAYFQHIGVQIAIWVGIKLLLSRTFARNPGVGEYYADALKENLVSIQDPQMWITMSTLFGFLWIPLVLLARHIRDSFARRALLVLPLFFAVSFCLAQCNELRIYGEMLPLVILGLACGMAGRDKRANERATALSARSPGLP